MVRTTLALLSLGLVVEAKQEPGLQIRIYDNFWLKLREYVKLKIPNYQHHESEVVGFPSELLGQDIQLKQITYSKAVVDWSSFELDSVQTKVQEGLFHYTHTPRLRIVTPTVKSVDIGLVAHYRFLGIHRKLPMTVNVRNFHMLVEATWTGRKIEGVPLIKVLRIEPSAEGTTVVSEKAHSLDLLGIYLDQSLSIFF